MSAPLRHSPAPWVLNKSGVSVDAGMTRIRQEASADRDELKANATLISTAPELLERLKIRVRECGCCGDPDFPTDLLCDECKADIPLIARAEGKS